MWKGAGLVLFVVLALSLGAGATVQDSSPPESEQEPEQEEVEELHANDSRVDWAQRFADARENGALDEFYTLELRPALRAKAAVLRGKLGGPRLFSRPRPDRIEGELDLQELYEELVVLYKLRVESLHGLSEDLSDKIYGVGSVGRRELVEEISYAILGAQYDAHKIASQREALVLEELEEEPLSIFSNLAHILLAILVFRWWRGWAPGRLEAGVGYFLRKQPRKRFNIRLAGLLWYLQYVRSPLEWLLLFGSIANATWDWLPGFLKILWPVAQWIFLARFVVTLIDAIVRRGAVGMRSESAGIRLRSLRLIAAWVVIIGLGRGVALTFAGDAVLYSWANSAGKVLFLPVALLLLIWWRREVFLRLARLRPRTAFTKGVLSRNKGMESYGATIVGGTYLSYLGLHRWFLRRLAGFEEGRRALATFAHREAVRLQERLGDFEDTVPIDEELAKRLVDAPTEPIEDYAQEVFERLEQQVEQRRNFYTTIVGERGLGKSALLERLAKSVDRESLIIDCPPGGFEAFVAAFGERLGIDSTAPADFSAALAKRDLSFVALDNAHHFVRPYAGGHEELDRLDEFARAVEGDFLWVITMEGTTWQYLMRARSRRVLQNEEGLLPAWSEEQIGTLIDAKCQSLGIKANYSNLVLATRYDEVVHRDRSEQNRFGFFRALWIASDANPEIAVRLFTESLVVAPDGSYLVKLFDRKEPQELQQLHLAVKLVLRFIALSELPTPEEIDRGLRLGRDTVARALLLCEARGYIEHRDDRYRLTWKWYRAITQWLARQNLLVRSRTRVAP